MPKTLDLYEVRMSRAFSIYLDLFRFIPALLVFMFHARYQRFDGDWIGAFGDYGHDAVMFFLCSRAL